MRRIFSLFLIFSFIVQPVFGQLNTLDYPSVRIKDVAKIIEARDNPLIGYGLVVGLRGTGDSSSTGVTDAAMANLLSKLGVPVGAGLGSRNVASVMVTATLPPFIKPGQRVPVIVSSMGDSNSLVGGQLLPTQLMGPDLKPYASAAGPVLVGGINQSGVQSQFIKNQTTVGRIPDGAIVEIEVPVTFQDQHNITIVMDDTNFITVSRASLAIQENGFPGARAVDANTIKIPLSDLESSDLVETIAKLENITLVPDASSKIVINERTGTIVIGERVRLFPVALTHGNISIRVSTQDGLDGLGGGGEPLIVEEPNTQVVLLNSSVTLTGLVNALNEIGATPKDLISILQALKEAGALVGTLELI